MEFRKQTRRGLRCEVSEGTEVVTDNSLSCMLKRKRWAVDKTREESREVLFVLRW